MPLIKGRSLGRAPPRHRKIVRRRPKPAIKRATASAGNPWWTPESGFGIKPLKPAVKGHGHRAARLLRRPKKHRVPYGNS